MIDWDSRIVDGLRSAMKGAKVSMRELSDRTGIPYRSLQNYLSGTTKMPASVYVQLCDALDVDNQFVLEGNFYLRHYALWDALHEALGEDGILATAGITLPSDGDSRAKARMLAANRLTHKISGAYDKERRHNATLAYGQKSRTTKEQQEWIEARGHDQNEEGPQ